MTEEPKKPRKKKVVSRRSKSDSGDMTDKETEYLTSLIQAGIEQARVKKMFDKTDRLKLEKMIQEFLDCYIVIGYNFQGEPVNLLSVESQQHADSLGTALTRFMAGLPRGPMNPYDSPDDY
jgi:hypothetical protein